MLLDLPFFLDEIDRIFGSIRGNREGGERGRELKRCNPKFVVEKKKQKQKQKGPSPVWINEWEIFVPFYFLPL